MIADMARDPFNDKLALAKSSQTSEEILVSLACDEEILVR